MDRKIAERLIASALALDPLLGEIDAIISQIPDEAERNSLTRTLGGIMGAQFDLIRAVEREYPDLAEKE